MPRRLSTIELKGAAMSILWALLSARHLEQVDSLATSQFRKRTGYKSPSVIRDALGLLGDAGYIVSPGTIGQGGEQVWMLSDIARTLFPFPPDALATLENKLHALPSADPPTLEKKLHASIDAGNLISSVPLESESVYLTTSSSYDQLGWPLSGKPLLEAYLQVLTCGPVFDAPARAKELMAEKGPAFLPHLLGHLATIKAGQSGYREPGVYLRNQAIARTPAAKIPPANLTYDQALSWALNGGMTEMEKAEAAAAAERDALERAAADARSDQAAAEREAEEKKRKAQENAQRAAELANPHYALWQAVLGQLALEMSKSTFETWVRNTTLVAVEGGNYHVTAATQYTCDWLEHRLRGAVQRVLASLTGAPVAEVKFTVQARASPTA